MVLKLQAWGFWGLGFRAGRLEFGLLDGLRAFGFGGALLLLVFPAGHTSRMEAFDRDLGFRALGFSV